MRALVAQWEAKRHQLAVSVPAEQPSKQLWPAIAARTQPAAVRRPSAQTSWLRPAGFGLGGLAAGVLAASAVFFTASALFMTADEIAMRTGEKLPQSYVGLLTDAAGNGKAVAMLLDTFEKLLSKVSKLIVTVETDRPVPQARMCFSTVIAQNYGDSPIICIRSGCGNFCVLCRQVLLAVRLFNPTITEFNMKKITFKQMAALPLLCFALAGAVLAADTPSDTPVAQAIDEMAAGRQAVKDKKWTQAISSFKKAIAENPKNADAHNMLGYSHRALGKFDDAFAAYDKALAIDPKHKGALEYSGMGYLKTNQKAKAEAQLGRLTAICAGCPETASLAKAVAEYKPGAVISIY